MVVPAPFLVRVVRTADAAGAGEGVGSHCGAVVEHHVGITVESS
jgi:hypothetical protein